MSHDRVYPRNLTAKISTRQNTPNGLRLPVFDAGPLGCVTRDSPTCSGVPPQKSPAEAGRSRPRQIDAVVHGVPQFLLAAETPLGRLHRDMPEQKLDLFQLPAGEVTQPGAAPAEVMRCELCDPSASGRPLHHVPYCFWGDVVTPDRAASADSAKDEAGPYLRCLRRVIYRPFNPAWPRNSSDVLALADQIGHNPVFFPDLKVVKLQSNQFGTPETASDENRQNCPIPFPRRMSGMVSAGVTGIDRPSASSRPAFPAAWHPSPIRRLPPTRDAQSESDAS